MKIQIDILKGVGEIEKAQQKLREYKEELHLKNEVFVAKLAELGCESVNTKLAELDATIPHDDPIGTAYIDNQSLYDVARMKIIVASSMILFVEFGTGIRYAGTVNPKAAELGYGAGTYPGKGHWDDPKGWTYMDDKGDMHHTYGIKAQIPMYNASVEMRERILEIAKEVFGTDD